ncbi:MAG: hypothetical protein ACLQU1_33965 [Bryobacteraceae bacterium]
MPPSAKFGRLWLALPLAVYLLLPTRNFYWDGVAFAIAIEKQAGLRETLHPSHLLYIPAGVWLYGAAAALGLKIRALFLLQTVNSLLAGAAMLLVYRALRRRAVEEASAIAGALSFAFAATWWKFSTDANAYVPAVLLILWAHDLLERRRSPWLAGVACCGAMLFHELAILFLPVALLRFERRRDAFAFFAAALVPVVVAYAAASRIVSGSWSPVQLAAWTVSHSPDSEFSFQPLRNLGWTLLGTLRLFFGGKPGAVLNALAVLAVFCGAGFSRGTPWVRRDSSRPAPRGFLCLWLALYAAFLFFWMPQNTFYRLFYLPPLILLAGQSLTRYPRLPALLAAALFLWNGAFFILPESRIANNPPLDFALRQRAHWPAGVPIVFHRFHPDLWTISYFNQQAAWIGFLDLDFALLDHNLAAARSQGQPLWIEATAYDFLSASEEGRRWLRRHEDQPEDVVLRERNREFRFCAMR